MKDAVLSGGSGVRNLTRVYRLTYDVDFDCQENEIDPILDALKEANATLGGRRNLDETKAGLITTQPGANIKGSFYGPNRLAKFSRWTKDAKKPLKLHIMNVPDLPEMFPGEMRKLETVLKIDRRVPNASRNCLFYRKAIRANKEARPEDFLDLTFILESSSKTEVDQLISFCSIESRKTPVSTGIQHLVNNRKNFRSEIVSRLAHARPAGPIDEWIEAKGLKLQEFIESIRSS